ncbi:MAG: putative 2OG-Fe(II) oxygenase [Candidatus Fonsibacter ubiquis]
MLKVFPNEFLYESYVSDQDADLLESEYKNSILHHKDFEETNIDFSKLKKCDYRKSGDLIDYSLCEQVLKKYIREFVIEHSIDNRCDYDMYIEFFYNFYSKPGDYMVAHHHDQTDLSMIYFLTDADAPTSFFPSNFVTHQLSNKLTKLRELSHRYDVLPEKGKFVIISPNLYHCVSPLENYQERISFVTNITLNPIKNMDNNSKNRHYFR